MFNISKYILKEGDERKDFDESVNFLTHTNILKQQENGYLEIIKLNFESFAMFSRVFLPTLQNYHEIYSILISANQTRFSSEKHISTFIQNNVFDIIKSQQKKNNTSLFDLEILSLNLISNAVLALRQFNILEKFINSVTKQNEFKIDIVALKEMNFKVHSIIKNNRQRLKQMINSFGAEYRELDYNIENEKISKL